MGRRMRAIRPGHRPGGRRAGRSASRALARHANAATCGTAQRARPHAAGPADQPGNHGTVDFAAGDATAYALAHPAPDLVVVNPPRRGLDEALTRWLDGSSVRDVVYSSCNVTTLARDLARMPRLLPHRARLFDMFPQTDHHEVLVWLRREAGAR